MKKERAAHRLVAMKAEESLSVDTSITEEKSRDDKSMVSPLIGLYEFIEQEAGLFLLSILFKRVSFWENKGY